MNKSDHEIDYFKTPSPSRRKMPQRSLFTDRCSRSQTSINQNKFQSDLDMLSSTPIFSSPMRSSKRDRCRTDPIPRKFRCEMPVSARKIEARLRSHNRNHFLVQHVEFLGLPPDLWLSRAPLRTSQTCRW